MGEYRQKFNGRDNGKHERNLTMKRTCKKFTFKRIIKTSELHTKPLKTNNYNRMKYIICFLLVWVLVPKLEAFSGGFINYFHIHELVKETRAENTRQKSIKTKQTVVGRMKRIIRNNLDTFRINTAR